MYAKIKIELGDETAVRNGEDVASALRNLAAQLDKDVTLYTGKRLEILDDLGNKVGVFKVKNKE